MFHHIIVIDKDKYILNEDGSISTRNTERKCCSGEDNYEKSINFLVAMQAITVNENYTAIEVSSPDQSTNYRKNSVDFDKVYSDLISSNGKYYGLLTNKEISAIETRVSDVKLDLDNEITAEYSRSGGEPFDFYGISTRNASLLYAVYGGFTNIGKDHFTATVMAGMYFADQVRSGGAWDYKSFLGYSTRYYCDLKTTSGWRTGESIGNLHYGVVGSVLFASGTLKSAAGMYQVFKGTSSFSYLSSYFDDPNDTADIVIGIGYHSSWNLNKVWSRL